MRVLWNGARNGPGGANLFVEETSAIPVEPPPMRTYSPHFGYISKRIRDTRSYFADRWFTAPELAEQAGITAERASTEIGRLVRAGRMVKARKPPMARQQYAWVYR